MTNEPDNPTESGGPGERPGDNPRDSALENLLRSTFEHEAIRIVPDPTDPPPEAWTAIEHNRRGASAPWSRRFLAVAAAVALLSVGAAALLRAPGSKVTNVAGAPGEAPGTTPGTEPPATAPVASAAPTTSTTPTTAKAPTTTATRAATTTTTAKPAPVPIRELDFRDLDYPTDQCHFGGTPPATVKLKGDSRESGEASYQVDGRAVILRLKRVSYGDITGNPTEDALLTIHCGHDASDDGADYLALVEGGGSQPAVKGALVRSGADRQATLDHPKADGTTEARSVSLEERLESATIENRNVVSHWFQAQELMVSGPFPTRTIVARHIWDGTAFVRVGTLQIENQPPKDAPT